MDVCDNVRLWGVQYEIKRHEYLSIREENKNKTRIEISEMVLNERWDLKMREELYKTVHRREYDGGDL